MQSFPHLQLSKRIQGSYKSRQGFGPKETNPVTAGNLVNRQEHGERLLKGLETISEKWRVERERRELSNEPKLPYPDVVPVHLKLDTDKFKPESLASIGIEVVSEEEDGSIIGASVDGFVSMREKIRQFLAEEGKSKDKAAQIWDLGQDSESERIEKILSEKLQEKWKHVNDADTFIVDISIACDIKIPDPPTRNRGEEETKFSQRYQKWIKRKEALEMERDDLAMERQSAFESFVKQYGGSLLSSFVDSSDSFSCRVEISGKGLKDIVINYPYIFEAVEYDSVSDMEDGVSTAVSKLIDINPPQKDSPKVCIIDSGIQEGHRLLSPAIDKDSSMSFVTNDASTADVAGNGGHGTRVAGAVLFPHEIPVSGAYELPCFIQNARVMVNHNGVPMLPPNLFPAELMQRVTSHFQNTRLFNMSITGSRGCRTQHMTPWAEVIDQLMLSKDVLFIVPTGNIPRSNESVAIPGVQQHLDSGKTYPDYLLEKTSRISDPAQSCFALTVGSVCHEDYRDDLKASFGKKDEPSSFSRTGLGLWGMIKPDVVEYGGDLTHDMSTPPKILPGKATSPELVRSTSDGGNEIGKDMAGTSYAAPRVTQIAALLQKDFPNESINLYRALIAQSARLPSPLLHKPTVDAIRHYGYGIPDAKRARENSAQRISYIASDKASAKQANVYTIKIPETIRNPGGDYEVLIEVTLAYMARPRRTRRKVRSYLSKWLSWESSKFHESTEQFQKRILKNPDDSTGTDDLDSIKWAIRENKDWSIAKDVRRQDSSLQKSWSIVESNKLPESLCFAVVGHEGWDKNAFEDIPYSIVISFESLSENVNLYEEIRIENEIEIPVEIEQEITL